MTSDKYVVNLKTVHACPLADTVIPRLIVHMPNQCTQFEIRSFIVPEIF